MEKRENLLIYRMKGFAIWGVAVIHAATLSKQAASNSWAVFWHNVLPVFSGLGVPIFFLLAGFLDHRKSAKDFWCKRLRHLIIPWIVAGTLVWIAEMFHFRSVAAFMPLWKFLLGYGSYLHFMRQIVILFILEFLFQHFPSIRIPSLTLLVLLGFSDFAGITSFWDWMTSYLFAPSSLIYFECGVGVRYYVSHERDAGRPISRRKLLCLELFLLAVCLFLRIHHPLPVAMEAVIQLLKVGLVYSAMKAIHWNRLNMILECWGKYSYAVYLLHMPVAGAVYHFDPTGWLYPFRGIVCVVITLLGIRILQWFTKHGKTSLLSLFAIPVD
ncbi:MAG: acyltransferase [Galactobacillus timonensis]|uniref:acyltransferase family protein n=1 Tax=Galactobacillus timonensis TaxID=2041840 RepID=UPI0023F3AB07|nr:acyltransferase [Galactobacillus timonensis]MCI6067731.1 acyltransferase [Galactobacillus timonensis]